jgi:hypothetical protein
MTESSEKKVDKNLRVPEKLLLCIIAYQAGGVSLGGRTLAADNRKGTIARV